MTGPGLRFYPYLRTGIVRHVEGKGADGIPSAATIAASVTVAGVPIPRTLSLRGPGHVVGIESSEILRTEPGEGSATFEPNYFPYVEFASPDLPWRFTPLAPTGQSLRPWLVLVVVRRRTGISITARAGGLLPVLTITAEADARTELPDLARSAAWAVVQHSVDAGATGTLAEQLAADPGRFVARLICPRNLEPNTSYIAALVPAFDAGRDAGLGATGYDPATLHDAWETSSSEVTLPVYHHWSFSTSAEGDFELLVQRLEPTTLDSSIGYRALDLRTPGSGLAVGQAREVSFEGALVAPASQGGWTPPASKAAFRAQLTAEVNRSTAYQEADGDANTANDPIVGPPIYAGAQAHVSTLDAAAPVWLVALNENPHWRTVAGLGAAVVRRNQEALVAGAWDQAGDQRAADKLVRKARLGAAVGQRLATRMTRLGSGALLQLTRGMHNRVRLQSGDVHSQTVHHDIAQSSVPKGMVSASFRRIARAGATPTATVFTRQVIAGKLDFTRLELFEMPKGAILETESCYGSQSTSNSQPVLVSLAPNVSANTRTLVIGTIGTTGKIDGARKLAATQELARAATRNQMLSALPTNTANTALGQAATLITTALQPASTMARRVAARIKGLGLAAGAPLPDRTQFTPTFDEPLYEDLLALGPEFLCPGIGSVAADTVGLLEVNAEFVASFLVGANHELARELAWREFPCPPDATFVRQFWAGKSADIDVLDNQRVGPRDPRQLGQLATARRDGMLVLLVRGELLRRYPDLIVYAVEAKGTSTQPEPDPSKPQEPRFTGTIDGSTRFWGFDVDVATARGDGGRTGWFFVIEQQPTAPRFGLDEGKGIARALPAKTDDWSWDDVALEANGAHANLGAAPFAGMSSAQVAQATYQRPVRFYAHARTMLPS